MGRSQPAGVKSRAQQRGLVLNLYLSVNPCVSAIRARRVEGGRVLAASRLRRRSWSDGWAASVRGREGFGLGDEGAEVMVRSPGWSLGGNLGKMDGWISRSRPTTNHLVSEKRLWRCVCVPNCSRASSTTTNQTQWDRQEVPVSWLKLALIFAVACFVLRIWGNQGMCAVRRMEKRKQDATARNKTQQSICLVRDVREI